MGRRRGVVGLAGVALVAVAGCAAVGGLPPPLADAPLDNARQRVAREIYERGVVHVGERRHDAAYAAFDSVVEGYPASRYSTVSLRERGLAAYRLGRHERAAADLRRLLAEAPGYETTDTAIVLASALQRMGDARGALETLVRELPERSEREEGARIVGEAAVRGLAPGQAERLAEHLPERPFLAPLFARAAEEVRSRDPGRAEGFAETARRLAGVEGPAARPAAAALPAAGAEASATVGAILPLEGRLATVAREVEDGARMALEELALGRGTAYELAVLPEGPGGAAGAALDRLAERGVRVVIGPLESAAARAAARAALERGVLLVSPTATDSTLLHMGPGIVTLNATAGDLGKAIGRFAGAELGIRRAAVIGSDDDYGHANAQGFRRAFEGAGGEVVLEAFEAREATSFGAALRLARRRGAEALFLPTRSADQILTVLSQVTYYSGGTFRLLGTEVWRDDGFLQRAGSFAEDAYFADTFSPDPRVTRYREFRAAYQERYGRPLPSNFPAWGYDAVMLALRHLSVAAASGEDGRGASVPREATYVGASATYRIREGSVEKVPVVYRIENGVPALAWIADRAR